MTKIARIILPILLLAGRAFAQAPDDFPKNYFRPPMDIPFSISGSYAEVRGNHFHSGIDLRTGGKVGEPVYAAADGYLGRVAISPWGGGKVLYIDHPNGLRTVYMHMNDFSGAIGDWVRKVQYQKHLYAIDTTLPKGLILIREGDLIGHSGNSGASGGPHLHFEVRYSENDQTINPFYFGFDYDDKVKPIIRNIKIYPASATTSVEGARQELFLYTSGKKGTVCRDTVHVCGPFYTGVYATDLCEAGSGKNGVEKLELYVDGTLFWRYQVPSFRFEDTRCINGLIDYPQYVRNKEYYLVSRRLVGVRTDFSLPLQGGDGVLQFNDTKPHQLRYVAYDYKGNSCEKVFFVKRGSLQRLSLPKQGPLASGTPADYRLPCAVAEKDFQAELKPYTLYQSDELLHFAKTDARYLSQVHTFKPRDLNLPPHQGYRLQIAVPPQLDAHKAGKLVVAQVDGKSPSALVSRVEGRWVVAPNVRAFGDFALLLDTIAPKVRPANFAEDKAFSGTTLQLKVSDNLSGIATYHCYLNGQWVLAEYDGKTASLYIAVQGKLHSGKNTLRCLLIDAVGNATDKTWRITRQ